jgi:hypothetical protein
MVAKNKINDLRDHLFVALEALSDPKASVDLERIKATCAVSKQIIESAKVEVAMVRAVNGSSPGTGFFNLPEESRELPRFVAGAPKKAQA